MEDVLDVYCRPYNEHEPLVCLDEMGKNPGDRRNTPANRPKQGKIAEKTTRMKRKGSVICSSPANRWEANAI